MKAAKVICVIVSCATAPPSHSQRIEPIVIEGQHAPGLPLGVQFGSVSGPVINSFGEVAFLADFDRSSPDVTSLNDGSVWLAGSSGLMLLARDSDPVQLIGLASRERNAQATPTTILEVRVGGFS